MAKRKPNREARVILFLLAALLLGACQISRIVATPTPPPTATLPPTATPSPTPRPTATLTCSLDDLVLELESALPYETLSVGHQAIGEVRILVVWYLEPELGQAGSTLEDNRTIALNSAAMTAITAAALNECVQASFGRINIIVVDPAYYGWLSISIPAESIPGEQTDDAIDALLSAAEMSYFRPSPPAGYASAPAGSCTWMEAESLIHRHFASSRANVAFQFILDETGANVWAQWDGPADPIIVTANLLNITMELQCLYPQPTQLFAIVVDERGNIQQVGLLAINPDDYMDISNYSVLYQR